MVAAARAGTTSRADQRAGRAPHMPQCSPPRRSLLLARRARSHRVHPARSTAARARSQAAAVARRRRAARLPRSSPQRSLLVPPPLRAILPAAVAAGTVAAPAGGLRGRAAAVARIQARCSGHPAAMPCLPRPSQVHLWEASATVQATRGRFRAWKQRIFSYIQAQHKSYRAP